MDYTDSHYEDRYDLDNHNDPDYYHENWQDEYYDDEDDSDDDDFHDEPHEDDVWADANALAGAGFGDDEDYGRFGDEGDW